MAPAKQLKIAALLEKLRDAAPAVNPCTTLAEIVNAGKCDLWVGARRTGHGPQNVEQMLSSLAMRNRTSWAGYETIAHRESSDGPLRAIDLTEAELRLSDVQRGAQARGISLPAGLGTVAPSRAPDQLLETLFTAAVRALTSADGAVSLKAARKWIVNLSPSERERFGVKAIRETAQALHVTDTQSVTRRMALTSLGRYFTKAKKSA
jgi:hypothetical protein